MSIAMIDYPLNNCLMEGYVDYLEFMLFSNKTIRRNVGFIRRLHNHVGKPYIEINKVDIQEYFSYLKDFHCIQYYTLSKQLSAIKNFYKYLQIKGEVIKNPCDGITIRRY